MRYGLRFKKGTQYAGNFAIVLVTEWDDHTADYRIRPYVYGGIGKRWTTTDKAHAERVATSLDGRDRLRFPYEKPQNIYAGQLEVMELSDDEK